jgi:hypothetical protein
MEMVNTNAFSVPVPIYHTFFCPGLIFQKLWCIIKLL